MDNFTPTSYKLKCIATGNVFEDTNHWAISDSTCPSPSLIRAIYDKKQIEFKDESLGIYRFADWLPILRTLDGSSAPITYKSRELAERYGFENLYITFNGWFPEIGAKMTTCSFKETEAYSVCARLPKDEKRILVVASAGNTARAFAKVCSANNIPLLLFVPQDNMNALWFEEPLNSCVKIICSPRGTDYYDAIFLSDIACSMPEFIPEGGAKNIARRDGMATTVLSATERIGRIPDYYLQAVGSGTGTIAAWEANMRLIEDGRWGNHKMVLIPSQNYPFLVMYNAWKNKSRTVENLDALTSRDKANEILAKVLSNRKPPYSLAGGLYDALVDTGGDMDCASNDELIEAANIFYRAERIDIAPAAAVAVACLLKRAKANTIDRNKVIMLNITGGGELRYKSEHKTIMAQPNAIIDPALGKDEIIKRILAVYK